MDVPNTPAPSSETAATAAPSSPSAETAAVSSPAPEAVAVESATPVETITPTTVLGSEPDPVKAPDPAPDPEAEKPAEAPAEGDQKKEEVAQSDEPAPLPTYEAFTLPEGIQMEDVKLEEFTKELAEFETLTKADHAEMQKFGQKLVDRYVAETQETMKRLNEYYINTWEKQKSDWKEAFEKDPEIGGNRRDTTVSAALQFIRTHGGDEAQQKEFRELMETTGIGNHPAMIRLLAKANMNMAEGKPLPATAPASKPTSRVDRRYGKA